MSSLSAPILYDLQVDLLDSEPPIWRRLWVNGETSLEALHRILVATMGWSGTADYRFKAQGPHFTTATDLGEGDRTRLLQAVLSSQGDSLLYTYNPTQGWLHRVTLEQIQRAEPGQNLPHCVAGERSCPPEFCEGVWGYEELLDRLSDSEDPECDALWEQVGYDFDPERFKLTEVNQRLQALSLP
jgi:hypothetical protein